MQQEAELAKEAGSIKLELNVQVSVYSLRTPNNAHLCLQYQNSTSSHAEEALGTIEERWSAVMNVKRMSRLADGHNVEEVCDNVEEARDNVIGEFF